MTMTVISICGFGMIVEGIFIYVMKNGAKFTDITTTSSSVLIGHPMGIDGADIDHDGDLDYYISNLGLHPLLVNKGDGTFKEMSNAAGTRGDFGWGLAFEDFNGDSWADLFVTQEDNRPYYVYTNLKQNPPKFSLAEVPHIPVNRTAHNVAAAFADYDHDGRVDAVTGTTDGSRIMLFHNVTDRGSNRWLEVLVPETPETGERGGINARIVVKTGDILQFRDITGGSSRASQNALSARFGLGQWSGAEWVAALWQDGRQLVMSGVAGNQRLLMHSGSDPTPPSAPKGLTAAANGMDVLLNWNENGEADFVGYNLYRSISQGGPYQQQKWRSID